MLDEPTSALDPIAEAQVYEQYADLIEGRTAIFISHRLASTRFCDRILFLKDGVVIEDGTHDVLMEKQGAYYELFQVQMRQNCGYENQGKPNTCNQQDFTQGGAGGQLADCWPC